VLKTLVEEVVEVSRVTAGAEIEVEVDNGAVMTVKTEDVKVTGQTVVDKADVKVMTVVEDTGQSVTLEAQLRMVCSTVV
jgi:uncharacterized protein YegL